ncbi:MAG: CehA/McbA family metallohydrolase [Candidatus Lokiarchaeota archaeon]|nr:CehA/McbA family metallohydrolase [Candidatus Lokiarchaeota archaeon]
MKRVWSKILKNFGIFMLIVVIIMVPSILLSVYGPRQYKYDDNSFEWTYSVPEASESNIIFDQHSHTKYSDGILTVRQNILWHIAHGFNAMVLTDHNNLRNSDDLQELALEYTSEFIIIQGMEWTTNRIHLNFLGISDWDLRIPWNPSDAQIQEAINEAHSQGAVVTVNHIPWSLERMPNHPTRQQLLTWGVDYIEIVNGDDYDIDSDSWCNNTGGFGSITGTDMHTPMNVKAWTLMNTTEFTADAIMNELRARNTTIIYNTTGSVDLSKGYNNILYDIFSPFIYIGEYFENFYANRITIPFFFSYLIAGFAGYTAIQYAIQKYKENKKRIPEKTEKK